MEEVNDLLDPAKTKLKIREDARRGVFVEGLTHESVGCLDDVYDILERGNTVKKMAETAMNANSSRSHCILAIHLVQSKGDSKQSSIQSQLNLVDLAGSERQGDTKAKGSRLKEAAKINLSLTTLAQVIQILAEGKKKIQPPFRNSSLTRLLKPALGGNARSGLSIHLSPSIVNLPQSISTLEFGSRAKMIKTRAKTNVKLTDDQLMKEISAITKENKRLKILIAKANGGELPPEFFDGDEATSDANMRQAIATEAEKVVELAKLNERIKEQNEQIRDEVSYLEEQLLSQQATMMNFQKNIEVRNMETLALESQMRAATASSIDLNGIEEVKKMQALEVGELRRLVKQQRQMLDREKDDNKVVAAENDELSKEVTDKTRMLALTELKLMDHESKRENESAAKRKNSTARKRSTHAARLELDNLTYRSMLGAEVLTARGDKPGSGPDVDYAELRKGSILESFGNVSPIPEDQLRGGRKSELKERVSQKSLDFVKRRYQVQDSFLLSFEEEEDQASGSKALPRVRNAIPLSLAKVGPFPPVGEEKFCVVILYADYFNVIAMASDPERTVWLRDLDLAKFGTHRNLVNLAYFNERAVAGIPDKSVADRILGRVARSPFARLGSDEYARSVPITGGIEGMVWSVGMWRVGGSAAESDYRQWYCVVMDCHMMVYDFEGHSERNTEPVHVMHLGAGLRVTVGGTEDGDGDGDPRKCYFSVLQTTGLGLGMTMYVLGEDARNLWVQALETGKLVTLHNVMRGAIAKETISIQGAGHMDAHSGIQWGGSIDPNARDLLGRKFVCPASVQPFDHKGKPLHHSQDGRLLRHDLKTEGNPKSERFGIDKTPLDPFDRKLPTGAAPMYTAASESIAVGLDGQHYAFPGGRLVPTDEAHFDGGGRRLSDEVVAAASNVLPLMRTATIMKSAVLSRQRVSSFDALGRPLKYNPDGVLVTVDGAPLLAEATVFDRLGQPLEAHPAAAVRSRESAEEMAELAMSCLGRTGVKVNVASVAFPLLATTLHDIDQTVTRHIEVLFDVPEGVPVAQTTVAFLWRGMNISLFEFAEWSAADLLPGVTIVARDNKGKLIDTCRNGAHITVDLEELTQQRDQLKQAEYDKAVHAFKRKRKSSRASKTGDAGAPTMTPRGNSTPASARQW